MEPTCWAQRSVSVGTKKTGETALKLAALGLSYAAVSGWVEAVQSTMCRWLKREPLGGARLEGRMLELDGLWTRTAAGLQTVYGRRVLHQLGHFSAIGGLREYRRNPDWEGWSEARRVMALTGGPAEYWRRQAFGEGRRHLQTGQGRFKITSRMERRNRECRRREKMGTVWSPHNLLILLQKRGLINQTT